MHYGYGMDIEVVRWFQQVADGMTVTDVSNTEMISQPAVSRALARLEKEVGAPLLQRSGRNLRLTHAGAAFKHHVDMALHHFDDGLAAVEQLVDPETGRVTISYQPSLGNWLIPSLISSFAREHPHVRFEVRRKSDERELTVGEGSDVDLEFSTLHAHGRRVWRRVLLSEPIRAVVPRDHRCAEAPEIALRELADEPFIMMRDASLLREHAEGLCRDAGFEPRIAFVAEDLPSVRGYVAAGLGVGIAPAYWNASVEPRLSAVHQIPLSDADAQRDIAMFWAEDPRLLPSARLFLEHVTNRAHANLLPSPVG